MSNINLIDIASREARKSLMLSYEGDITQEEQQSYDDNVLAKTRNFYNEYCKIIRDERDNNERV